MNPTGAGRIRKTNGRTGCRARSSLADEDRDATATLYDWGAPRRLHNIIFDNSGRIH